MKNNKEYNIPNDALVILVGVAGSGKSTIAKKISSDSNAIISSDNIREELFGDANNQTNNGKVFDEFYKRIEERLANGKLAIADATSIAETSRKSLYDIAIRNNKPIRIIIMNIPLMQIIMQNNKRDRKVPEYRINKMFNSLKEQYRKIEEETREFPDVQICDIVSSCRYTDENERE